MKKFCKCGCSKEANHGDWVNGHWNRGKRGRICSEETKKRISNSNKGNNYLNGRKRFSKEHNKKISIFNKGKKLSEVHKNKIRNTLMGRKHTEEAKRKMSISRTGIPLSIEHKKKVSESLMGRIISNEWRMKISKSRKGKCVGEKCPAWQGGKSFEEYGLDWTDILKESIRQRDNYCCRLCGKKQKNRNHDVHHINYDKQNNNLLNLITLCDSCHPKTNFNRNKWVKIFLKK